MTRTSAQADSYYEERASQEEIYLEEMEEEVRMILECVDPPIPPSESPISNWKTPQQN